MAEKAAAVVGYWSEVWLVEAVVAGKFSTCREADASMIAQTHAFGVLFGMVPAEMSLVVMIVVMSLCCPVIC